MVVKSCKSGWGLFAKKEIETNSFGYRSIIALKFLAVVSPLSFYEVRVFSTVNGF